MTAPALTIRLELESTTVTLLTDCVNDSEYQRLRDWLDGQPDLCDLVARALELDAARPA